MLWRMVLGEFHSRNFEYITPSEFTNEMFDVAVRVFLASWLKTWQVCDSKPNVVTAAARVAHTPGGAAKVAPVSAVKRSAT